jgi:hypothetical protein
MVSAGAPERIRAISLLTMSEQAWAFTQDYPEEQQGLADELSVSQNK